VTTTPQLPRRGSRLTPPQRTPVASRQTPADRRISSARGAAQIAPPTARGSSARIVLSNALNSENSNFYLLLGTVVFLVIIGLIVVFSASSIDSFLSEEGFFGGFLRQAGFAVVGIPLMLIVAKLPLVFWPTWAKRLLGIGIALQLLVFSPIGIETGGNRNWIAIGSFTAQPSEAIKIVIAVWLGVAIPIAIDRVGSLTWRVLLPALPAAGLMVLVLLGSDLGTVIIMAIIVMGCLIFAGLPWRILLIPAAIGAGGVALMAWTSPNRMNRILSFLSVDGCTDYSNACWQPLHGLWAMANGGIFGVGLGNSKSKWSWLPAADNDYIFAIIGEEMGLIGSIVVIALYIFLAVLFLRIIRDTDNRMIRIVTGGIMFWIIGQAAINIGVVVGILPVLGVPLPFLSSGGTALVSNLVAIGIVLSFARAERDARRAMRSTTTSRPRSRSTTSRVSSQPAPRAGRS